MTALIRVPREFLETTAALRFPIGVDRRLQTLMDRNNEGTLGGDEAFELQGLVELSELIGWIRAQALCLLGHAPKSA
jgi:hypothetical protein